MVTYSDVEQAQNEGSLAAARELLRLEVDQSQSVDVFSIIERARLWLFFAPLDNALGVYQNGGILINNQRPRSVQRYTAAHEYGHFVLGHENSLDGSEIERSPARFRMSRKNRQDDLPYVTDEKILEEAAANAFAIDFLLSPPFVNRMWEKFEISEDESSISVDNVYHLSLFSGVSYTATIHQLAQLNKLSASRAREFLKVTPKSIKVERGQGVGPEESRADVWSVDHSFSGVHLEMGVKDEVHIKLRETPSTGYLWAFETGEPSTGQISHPADARAFSLVSEEFEVWNALRVGSGGIRHFKFRGQEEGTHQLHLVKCRPWQTGQIVDRFDLEVQLTRTDLEGPRGDQKLSLLA
jgi:Zn-dependent peptidase ImmA (M78 family)/predicted secreted protein